MMREKKFTIVFFMIPYWGHITPHLNVISKLKELGYHVVCFCGSQFASLFEERGISMYSYEEEILQNYQSSNFENQTGESQKISSLEYKKENMDSLFYSRELLTKNACLSLLDQVTALEPDLILYDSYAYWGLFLARKLSIPAYCMEAATVIETSDTVYHEYMEQVLRKSEDFEWAEEEYIQYQEKLNRRYERSMKAFIGIGRKAEMLPDKVFVYESKDFHQAYSDEAIEVECLGWDMPLESAKMEKRGVFLTRGTMNRTSEIDLFCKIFSMLQSYKGQVVATLGDKQGRLSDVRDHIVCGEHMELLDFVDQLDQLQKHQLFICHGGIAGVREAIICETPMIVIPRNYHCFQVGKAVEKLKIGKLILESELTEEVLLTAIEEIQTEPVYKENIERQKKQFIDCSRNNSLLKAIYSMNSQKER